MSGPILSYAPLLAVGSRVRMEMPDQSLGHGVVLDIDKCSGRLTVQSDSGQIMLLYPDEVMPVERVPVYKNSMSQDFEKYRDELGKPEREAPVEEPLRHPTPMGAPHTDPLESVFKPHPEDEMWDNEGSLSDAYVEEARALAGIVPKYSSYANARSRSEHGLSTGRPAERLEETKEDKIVAKDGSVPDWVVDPDVWERAKASIEPFFKRYDEPFAVITQVYKVMGGRIEGGDDPTGDSKNLEDGIVERRDPTPVKDHAKSLGLDIVKLEKAVENLFDSLENFEFDWGQEPKYAKLASDLSDLVSTLDDNLLDIKKLHKRIK